ncbi:hypothetical protein COOONC_03413 [Cooperia oncophora]
MEMLPDEYVFVRIEVDVHELHISMKIIDPDGREVHYTVVEENPHKFLVIYTPLRDGVHHISLSLRDIALGTTTAVEDASCTVEALPIARLCPYTDRVRVGDVVPLRVEGAVRGPVEVVIVDAKGNENILAVIVLHDPYKHIHDHVHVSEDRMIQKHLSHTH